MSGALSTDASRAGGAVTAHLRYAPPYDWAAILAHLDARAVLGVEEVAGGAYRRTAAVGRRFGSVEVRHEPRRNALSVTIHGLDEGALPKVLDRVRRVFDVDADIGTIAAHLSGDPSLAPLVTLRPGLRVPGGWDGFELAVRAVLGQQVTVGAARGLAGRLVALCGSVLKETRRPSPGLSHLFPPPERVAAADLGPLGMPNARRAALKSLAEAAIADPGLFTQAGSVEEAVARLRAIRGVGEWTAHYVALRALRQMDAFPASDIGLLRGAAVLGRRPTPAELLRRAEPWRPWRGYAAQHLWAGDAARDGRAQAAQRGPRCKPSRRSPCSR